MQIPHLCFGLSPSMAAVYIRNTLLFLIICKHLYVYTLHCMYVCTYTYLDSQFMFLCIEHRPELELLKVLIVHKGATL